MYTEELKALNDVDFVSWFLGAYYSHNYISSYAWNRISNIKL